jgi:hypothetical protein
MERAELNLAVSIKMGGKTIMSRLAESSSPLSKDKHNLALRHSVELACFLVLARYPMVQ